MPRYPYVEGEWGKPDLDAVWDAKHCPEGFAGRPVNESYHFSGVDYQVRTTLPETPGQALKNPIDGKRVYWWVTKVTSYVYYTADWVQTRYDYWRTNVQKHHIIEERLTPKRWTTSIHKVLRDSNEIRLRELEASEDSYINWYEDFLRPQCVCLPVID